MRRKGGLSVEAMASRVEKKKAVSLGDALQEFLKQARLSSGHNTQRIFNAWDEASGAARYTIGRYFRDGVLTVTMNSSVARSTLEFQKADIVAEINRILAKDELFIKDDPNVSYVKSLVLK